MGTAGILSKEKCTACRRDSPRVNELEINELKPQIPGWALVERDGIQRLERVFRFHNFAEALGFTNRVGSVAEGEGHHPAILTEWGRVTVTLWTHKIEASIAMTSSWLPSSIRWISHKGRFEALTTTSAGLAFALGRHDCAVTREETLANAKAIVDATDLRVAGDLENGYVP